MKVCSLFLRRCATIYFLSNAARLKGRAQEAQCSLPKVREPQFCGLFSNVTLHRESSKGLSALRIGYVT